MSSLLSRGQVMGREGFPPMAEPRKPVADGHGLNCHEGFSATFCRLHTVDVRLHVRICFAIDRLMQVSWVECPAVSEAECMNLCSQTGVCLPCAGSAIHFCRGPGNTYKETD